MKILIIGFFALFTWSSLATYIYVCKIRGLCDEPMAIPFAAANRNDVVNADTLHTTLVQEQAVIPNKLTIYFAFDKSEFNSDTETDRYFDISNAYLVKNSQARLSITGFTDAIGSDEYNQALGYRRAQRMQHYFESKGLPSNRITIVSKGENEPADDNNTVAGRANNRRASIIIKK